jgi:hypothetical protein
MSKTTNKFAPEVRARAVRMRGTINERVPNFPICMRKRIPPPEAALRWR